MKPAGAGELQVLFIPQCDGQRVFKIIKDVLGNSSALRRHNILQNKTYKFGLISKNNFFISEVEYLSFQRKKSKKKRKVGCNINVEETLLW